MAAYTQPTAITEIVAQGGTTWSAHLDNGDYERFECGDIDAEGQYVGEDADVIKRAVELTGLPYTGSEYLS